MRPDPAAFSDACAALDGLLNSPARRELSQALTWSTLGDAMQAHRWRSASAGDVRLASLVQDADRRTRADGFHVLHDWDGIADRVNDEIIPIDVLRYVVAERGTEPASPGVVAVLIDYYFFHLLTLLAVRVWDADDPDAAIDRVGRLLDALQGEEGSGHRFVADAETLLLIATSHFELEERGYATLLERVRTLNPAHRLRVAIGHASSLGSHLRFGFEATYGRDSSAMRRDNVADYPWLTFALETLAGALAEPDAWRGATGADEREPAVEALLNGLSADPPAYITAPWLRPLTNSLATAFEPHRPASDRYSPLSFFFNFAHNVVKGAVIDALLWSEPRRVSFNDLLTALPRDAAASTARIGLATTLMAHARSKPHRIRGRWMPVIVYDPSAARLAYGATMRAFKAL